MSKPIVIIGGGLAGLSAAYDLAQAGHAVHLLEARARLGGRCWTNGRLAKHASMATRFDLGAETFHGMSPAHVWLASVAGVAIHEASTTRFTDLLGCSTGVDLEGILERFLNEKEAAADIGMADRSLPAVIERLTGSDAEKVLLVRYFEGFHAADLTRLGAHEVRRIEAFSASIDGFRASLPEGGTSALVEGLMRALRALSHVTISTESAVVAWEVRQDGVRLRLSSGAELNAEQVISSVPLPIQKSLLATLPLTPEQRAALDTLHMGEAVKLHYAFAIESLSAWGYPNAEMFVVDSQMEPRTWWRHDDLVTGLATVTGWVGGPESRAWLTMTESARLERGLRAIAGRLGVSFDDVNARVVAMASHNWSTDPWTRGAYSYLGVGGQAAQGMLTQLLCGRIVLCGEAFDYEGQTGTIDAAVRSGRRAAETILTLLRERCKDATLGG